MQPPVESDIGGYGTLATAITFDVSDKYERLTIDRLNDDGVMHFMTAFVKDVADDFNAAFKGFLDNKNDKFRFERYVRIKDYILSRDFCDLTNLDGNAIVEGLERHVLELYD